MKNLGIILFLLIFSLESFSQEKRKIEADKKSSKVEYAMKHPLHAWEAVSKESKSIIVFNDKSQKIEAVAVIIPIKSFDSGNSNRDSHAIEVLEALKFPNVTFSASNIQESGSELLVKGNLSFHGVTKPLELKVQQAISKTSIKIIGDFTVNMTDFNIEPPGLMGLKTEEKIALKFVMVFNL